MAESHSYLDIKNEKIVNEGIVFELHTPRN